MQLKRRSLTAATLGLLGAAVTPPQASALDLPSEQLAKKWEFDTALLVYSESDSRVTAVEPVLRASRDLGDERLLSFKLVVDSLTGASPNGATPASTPQTFTRPSGNGAYTIAPGELPLDDTFKDTRVALSGDYSHPLGEHGTLGYGLNASTEYDFLSAGGSLRYAHDFNQNNTTLSAGLSFESDQVKPVGGVPVPLTQPENKDGSTDSKSVTDVVLGLSQVLDPNSLVQFNYSLSTSSGYHTDPYKILSVVDANGEPLRYVYEARPDSRTKHALFARYKRFVFSSDVLDVSYRFMSDDWGVTSSTVDTLYRWNFGGNKYLEPHLRWYTQSAADFYHYSLADGEEATVDFASADPRLSQFSGYTFGVKYGHSFDSGNSWSLRGEFYQQNDSTDMSAMMLTAGYRFRW